MSAISFHGQNFLGVSGWLHIRLTSSKQADYRVCGPFGTVHSKGQRSCIGLNAIDINNLRWNVRPSPHEEGFISTYFAVEERCWTRGRERCIKLLFQVDWERPIRNIAECYCPNVSSFLVSGQKVVVKNGAIFDVHRAKDL